MRRAVKKIHFVGIGGVGMSGIAEVLFNLGYEISGSDLNESSTLNRLKSLGIPIFIGHEAGHILKCDVVVTSTAILSDNPEVSNARKNRIPVIPRAVMLAELMRFKQGIAIAGTHGKTTTTSLVASVLNEAGLDPTYVIGGRLIGVGTNAKLGRGDYIVVEADESDASFLNLLPVISVVTNIDSDHMQTYDHDFEKLKSAFVNFLHKMPFYGVAILCTDDPNIRSILPNLTCQIISYGFETGAQVRAENVRAVGNQMKFTVKRKNGENLPDLDVILNLTGRHNVLNALSAIAVARELNIDDISVQKALFDFTGVDRRFQIYNKLKFGERNFTLIDDYGHHPVELEATISAAREAFPNRRLVLVFQPHRYSRTRDCFNEFIKVIKTVDLVLLTEVYPAGEDAIPNADGISLMAALNLDENFKSIFIKDVENLAQVLLENVMNGDVVLCMGAGSIGSIPGKVLTAVEYEKS